MSEASSSGSKTESCLEEGIFYMDKDNSNLKPIEEGSFIEQAKLKNPYDDQLKIPFISDGKKIEIRPAENGNVKNQTETIDDESEKIFGKLIGNLQNLADSLSIKSERSSLPKQGKQLNFRSREEIINDIKGLQGVELRRPKRESRLPMLQIRRPDNLSIKKYSPGGDPTQIFYESEKLLDGKLSPLANVKWSDANSVTSPSTCTPESPFGSNRYRRKNGKYPRRAVLKNGECNVLKKSSLSKRRLRYLQDIFTTLVDTKWRWTLLVFTLGFMMSWLFYAGIYWLIAFTHGDFDHLEEDGWTPCVENLFSFASCFLFSVETQHTIGYGGRSTNEECPEAIFVMCIQSVTGVMISAFMAGVFFAKMARPKQRRQTLLFSRRAVICQRDGLLCIMFRVGDMRKSHIIGASIRAHLFRTRTTREGEELYQYQCELPVSVDGCESGVFFIWPLTVIHVIDKDSPLYSISAQELLHETLEIVAILEGTVESTGQTTQARTSYIPSEIKWGHRFEKMLAYNEDRQGYELDFKKFNNTLKIATPLCSAKDLEELYLMHSEICDYNHAISMDASIQGDTDQL